MPQIDHPTLLERLNAIFDEAAGAEVARPDGQWQAPMAALNEPPRKFADVYGADGAELLLQLSHAAQSREEPNMARIFETLQVKLRDGSLDLEQSRRPAPRLAPFVYPVV